MVSAIEVDKELTAGSDPISLRLWRQTTRTTPSSHSWVL